MEPKKNLEQRICTKKRHEFSVLLKTLQNWKNECTNSKSAGNFAKINTTWENDL